MRDVTGSTRGADVEAAFHRRIRQYIGPDGRVWSHPGAFNEQATNARYTEKDRVIHIWGATKILMSLAEDYRRTRRPESQQLARKVMLALKRLAVWDAQGRCWLPCGMGALRADGTVVPNAWNRQPAPIVEPLVTYWLATHDQEGLDFAVAYAEGMLHNLQPDGIRFPPSDAKGASAFPAGAHSHATMHAVWGVAHLGLVTGKAQYLDFARRLWEGLGRRGTGTGWFPAGPDNCNETCCVSDMISVAVILARSGRPEYFDYAERFFRNYISNLQFFVTPEFEAAYRARNATARDPDIQHGLETLRKFQGGIIGGSGLNDYENALLGGVSGFEMFGCCAPEGMRAIHTVWVHTIDRWDDSVLGPAGIYVNHSFSRESRWGRVLSALPDEGRLTVTTAASEPYFLRPPHWAPRAAVGAFVGRRGIPVRWSGSYVRFDVKAGEEIGITYPLIEFTHEVRGLWSGRPDLQMSYRWRGNSVIAATPRAEGTALFLDRPRSTPIPPTD
ncbi:MAG: hypothetical protein U1G07_25670 [Verrucomicrobiota bacterium]